MHDASVSTYVHLASFTGRFFSIFLHSDPPSYVHPSTSPSMGGVWMDLRRDMQILTCMFGIMTNSQLAFMLHALCIILLHQCPP